VDYLCELNFADGSSARSKISNLLNGKIRMPKDQPLAKTFEVYTNKKIKYANIALLGKYTREDGGDEVRLEDVYQYSFLTKKVGFLQADEKSTFLKLYNLK